MFKILLSKLVNNGLSEVTDVEIIRKINLLNSICLIGIIHTTIFGSLNVFFFNATIGFLNYAVAIVLILGQLALWKFSAYKHLIFFGVLVTGILISFLFITGGIKNTGHLWIFVFPLFSIFFFGLKNGSIASILLITISIIAINMGFGANNLLIQETGFVVRLGVAFLLVLLFTFLFEQSRAKTQLKIIQKNQELKKLTDSLMSTSEDLESQVAQYTIKLFEAEERIKELEQK